MNVSGTSLTLKSKQEIDIDTDTFLTAVFGDKFSDEVLAEQFRYKMISMIYSHRHEKSDRYLEEIKLAGHELKFDVIRDVMYKYSKQA